MKATRIYFLLLSLCLSTQGFAQSNAHPDYNSQHKSAQKYQKHQKSLVKQHQKQEKAEAKQAKAWRKQHQQ